jgi:hypothetical protein
MELIRVTSLVIEYLAVAIIAGMVGYSFPLQKNQASAEHGGYPE